MKDRQDEWVDTYYRLSKKGRRRADLVDCVVLLVGGTAMYFLTVIGLTVFGVI